MKKSFLTALLFVLLSVSAFSQEQGESNIKVGAGMLTTNTLLGAFSGIFITGLTLGGIEYENNSSSGAFYFTYEYAVINRLMIGASFVYESVSQDMFSRNSSVGKVSHNYITTGLEANYHYISSRTFQMYSGLGAAYTSQKDKYEGSLFGVQNGSVSF